MDAAVNRRVIRPPDPPNPSVPPDPQLNAILAVREKERVYFASSMALTTVLDMAIFGQTFLNGGVYGRARVLSPASVNEMTRNQIPGIGAAFFEQFFTEASWGLGWSVHGPKTGLAGSLYSSRSFEHWGAGGTYLWVDPEFEIVGVYFSSTVISEKISDSLKYWRNDLFTDAVTAAVVD
jgi:CubicO group peptidase (beta-lactamase class C family)